jgi:glycerophosphoryl diester phosphodiesterase
MTAPLLLGHRGARASRDIPENTVESFELCLQQGCDGFEFDVRLAADGQAVICHDAAIRGMKIEKTASRMLGLPTLQQVLEKFSSRAFLDIELKVAGLEHQTMAELRRLPPQKGFVVSSFLPDVLTAIRALDAFIPLGYLCEKRGQLQGWKEFPAQWVIPRCDLVDQGLVQEVHQAGKKIMLWTVNGASGMQEFAKWGVDAIISDETELLVTSLRAGSKD